MFGARTLRLVLLAVGVAAVSPSRVDADATAPSPLPAGVTACQFDASSNPPNGQELVIRDAPSDDGQVLGSLTAAEFKSPDGTSRHEVPQFRVLGFKNGWFLVEGAQYPTASQRPAYTGRGWVDGKFVSTQLFRDTLKKTPSYAAEDVIYLYGTDTDGISGSPYTFPVKRITGCSGPWFEIEAWMPGAKTPSGKPAAGNGMVRGWTDRSCVRQNGPCDEHQFDYPWSPLPDGVTECNFRALSRDPDPAGLNVREAPDRNARILGQVQPPVDILGTKLVADVHVIGYQKGWFLVALGPYDPQEVAPHGPKPFTGRGWVAGEMLTTELLRFMLKQEPRETAADLVNLFVIDAKGWQISDPQSVKVRRILSCSGDWVHVEIALAKGVKPLIATATDGGIIRGWSNGTCTNQLTTCDFSQDRPWSPEAPIPPE